jgi:hypothetical protein
MENRTNKQVTDIIDYILEKWDLSVNEEELLDSVLLLFSAQKIEEMKKIEHIVNDETEDLLKLLDSYDIQRFVERHFDMVAECEECKSLEDYDDDDLLDECANRDINWEENRSRLDIITQSDLEEMTELFLNLSPQKRSEIIKQLQ